MTYYVFGGTLSLTQSITEQLVRDCCVTMCHWELNLRALGCESNILLFSFSCCHIMLLSVQFNAEYFAVFRS